MSNCVQVFLPPTARVDDVALALAALHGVPVRRVKLDSGSFYAVADVKVKATSTPEMVDIRFTSALGEGISRFYHFESDGEGDYGGESAGWRFMSFGSTARNIAVALRLVKLFGGRVVYQDEGPGSFSEPDYRHPVNPYNAAKDGVPWATRQNQLANIAPVTQKEVDSCAPFAGYDHRPSKDVSDRGFNRPAAGLGMIVAAQALSHNRRRKAL